MAENPEKLLAHDDFMRGLAMNLIADTHWAEDIHQQTLLASLERSPPAETPLRAWLSRIAWNLAVKLLRGENRRWKREAAAARPDRAPSAEEVAAREEIRRTVVAAVLSLEEPYRSAILLRFYDDLPPREIAKTLRIPVETVRTRLKRGLAKLRGRLDHECGGDRSKWVLAVAPIAGLKLSVPHVHAAAGAAASLAAASMTAFAVKTGLAALILLGSSLWIWRIASDVPDDRELAPPASPEARGTPGESRPDRTRTTGGREAAAPGGPGPVAIGKISMKPSLPVIAGRVINEVTGLPVTNFQMHLLHDGEGRFTIERGGTCTLCVEAPGLSITNFQLHLLRGEGGPSVLFPVAAAIDAGGTGCVLTPRILDEGRYAFTLDRGGSYTLYVEAPGYIPPIPIEVRVAGGERLTGFTVALEPWQGLSGRVVEDATGRPVPGARVYACMITGEPGPIREWDESTSTDLEGRFTLTRLKRTMPDERSRWIYTIAACHPEYAEYAVPAVPNGQEIELRLEKGYRVHGTVSDSTGRPLPGAAVRLWGGGAPMERTVSTDGEGRFVTPPAAPGIVEISVSSPGEESLGEGRPTGYPSAGESRAVELIDRDVEVFFGGDPRSVAWRGTLCNSEGRPAAGGRIEVISLDPPDSEDPWLPDTRTYFSECDPQGRFEISGMRPGGYEIRLRLPEEDWGLEGYAWHTILFEHPGEVNRDIRLPATEVRGRLFDEETGEPVERGTCWIIACPYSPQGDFLDRQFVRKTGPDGCFCFKGLPPGAYSFGAGAVFEASGLVYAPSGAQVIGPIPVSENRSIKGLDMALPVRGTLLLLITGMEVDEREKLEAMVLNMAGAPVSTLALRRMPGEGSLESALHWEVGSWILVLQEGSLGRVERPFKIFRNRETLLKIDAGEFPEYGTLGSR